MPRARLTMRQRLSIRQWQEQERRDQEAAMRDFSWAPAPADACGEQEQPAGYRCNRKRGHKGLHACMSGPRTAIVKWSAQDNWRGPVLHGAEGPKAPHTYCGVQTGTKENPTTYTDRLVRCKACLAVLTPSEKVVVPRKRPRRK